MSIELGSYSINTWPLGFFFLTIILFGLRRNKRSYSHLFCFFIFSVYVLYVIDKVFFPIAISGAFADAARESPLGGSYSPNFNFIPFSFGPHPDIQRAFITSTLNIILTLPFGFALPFMVSSKAQIFRWLIAIGLILESTQLSISVLVGYLYRVIDVNDVIFNTLGAFIGYIAFRFFARIYIRIIDRSRNKYQGLAAYVYAISTHIIEIY